MITCRRCKGTGYRAHYAHIENGRCFGCDGAGVVPTASERLARDLAAATEQKAVLRARAESAAERHREAPTSPRRRRQCREALDAYLASCNAVMDIQDRIAAL